MERSVTRVGEVESSGLVLYRIISTPLAMSIIMGATP